MPAARLGRLTGSVRTLGLSVSLLLSACGAATGAQGGATSVAGTSAAGTGNFVFAKLAYNEQIFSTQGTAGGNPMFDQSGNALDGTDPGVPNGGKPGTVQFTVGPQKVPFQFPGMTGKTSEMVPNGGQVDIAVTPGKYKTLYFLESTGNGTTGGAAIDLSLNYTDASSDKSTITVTDWTLTQSIASGSSEVVAFTTSDEIHPDGSSGSGTFGVYVDPVPLKATKELKDISVSAETGDSPAVQFNILAITLDKA